jgi:hypothetical protein
MWWVKPNYFKNQCSSSSFLLTKGNNTGLNYSRLVPCIFKKHGTSLLSTRHGTKSGFFSESAICFSNLQISQKNYIPKTYPELRI